MPMRQLRSCDFCDEEATGVYEVVPPELSPTEGEQRRLVLCGDCRETLEGVLAPLLARLGVEGEAEGDENRATPADEDVAPTDSFADDDPGGTSLSESGQGGIPDLRAGGNEPSAGGSGGSDESGGSAGSVGSDEGGGDGERDDGDSNKSDDATDGHADVGLEIDAADSDAGPDRVVDEEALPPLDGSDAAAPTDEDSESKAESGLGEADEASASETADDGPTSTAAPGEEPPKFRTVMRLLGNREFPVARGEIVELATSAYDLGEGEVDEILAYAVDRDLLEDDGETLRKA
ncbi:hypothetical protein [Halobellus rubicundus]|uniref:DUF2240 family protein n=1 Tax=Halobellus rubicundus TaxID=2996466 RepID=A0ABD5MAU0_9EURY